MAQYYSPEGCLLETPENAEHTQSLVGLEYAMSAGLTLEGRVCLCDSDHNLVVELGKYRGIIPRNEAVYSPDGEPVKDIAVITRVGKPVCFKVTSITRDDANVKILLSRRLAQKECCDNFIFSLSPGDIIDAKITHMEPFGCFCDIGCGVISLLSVDCISVSRISHPKDRFHIGQYIKCAVRQIDNVLGRVTLTHKELLGTWEQNASRFNAGETAAGIIRSIEPYGVFVELMPNLAGLAEWFEDAKVGQSAAVYIKSIIPEKMKIKLVIVDGTGPTASLRSPEYFISDGHIDRWNYSPAVCDKTIFTDFT